MSYEHWWERGAPDDFLDILYTALKVQLLENLMPLFSEPSSKVNCPTFPSEIGKMGSPGVPAPTTAP